MVNAPVDTNIRIIPANAPIGFRGIVIIRFVQKFHMIGQCHKAVSKPAGNQQLFFIFFRKLHTDPLLISRTVMAKIHRYIQDRPAYAPYQLCLRFIAFLKMNASQRPFYRTQGMIILHEIIKETGFFHRPTAPAFHKKAAMITEHFGNQNIYTL